MKISVELDCSPEEARRFMGLPDLSSVQDAYVSHVRAAFEQGITPDAIHSAIQGWPAMGEAGVALWRQMFEQIAGASAAR